MGYRSDIVWGMSKELHEQFMEVLDNSDEKIRNNINKLLSITDVNHVDKHGWLVYLKSVKWYSDYDDVMFIKKFFKNSDSKYYIFYRIGENVNDTEMMGAWWENPYGINLFRHVDFFISSEDDKEK